MFPRNEQQKPLARHIGLGRGDHMEGVGGVQG